MNLRKIVGLTIPAVAAFALIGWNWNSQVEKNKTLLETKLEGFAKQAAAVIDGDRYASLIASTRISKDEYEKLLEPLVQLHFANPEVAHLYTISSIGNKPWVILDTAARTQKNPAHLWSYQPPNGQGALHPVPEPDPAMLESLKFKKTTKELGNPARKSFGADAAIYTPILTSNGQLIGSVGATMNKKIQAEANDAAKKEALIYLGILGVFLIAGMFIGSGSKADSMREKNLRLRLEQQFRTMTEKLPGVVFSFAARHKKEKGEFVLISGGIKAIRGIEPQDAETNWNSLAEIIPTENRDEYQKKIAQAIRDTRAWEIEFESGGRWIQATAHPQKEADMTLWCGTMVDITNRKRDEEKLTQTNAILSEISQATNPKLALEGICTFGANLPDKACVIHWVEDGKIRAIAGQGIPDGCATLLAIPRTLGESEGAAATCGIGEEANHIASLADSVLYRKAQDLREALLEADFKSSTCYPIRSGGTVIGAIELLHKDAKPDPDNSVKDIQTSRLAETALERMYRMQILQENEKRYRTLFENAPVGICELDENGKKVFGNGAFENNLQPETQDEIEGSAEEEFEIKDGKRTLLVESRNIRKSDGKTHRISFAYDISQQKNKEEEALISKRAAEEANREKSKFLAVMSHEIRTPLHGIIGFADLLEKNETDPQRKTYATRIRKCGETLHTTINDILDLSKIEAGRIELERRGFDPKDTFENIIEMLATKANEKGVDLKLNVKDLEPIHSDETRLSQIVTNLVGNAIKFTERGSVSVTAKTKDGKLFVTIKDTGIGISEIQQTRLFQPFSQADPSTTRKFGGTGLGLVISKKLCELLGGEITLKSEIGKGTTFQFWIEAPKGTVEKREKVTLDKSEVIPLNILIAEDDENNRVLIGTILKSFGHQVEFAVNGEEAVARAEELSDWTDVMLMDMRMPKLDGVEATRQIKAGGFKKFPIIALTANAMQEDQDKCLAAGMDNYLSKPLNIVAFQKALQLCQKEKKRKELSQPQPSLKAEAPTPATPAAKKAAKKKAAKKSASDEENSDSEKPSSEEDKAETPEVEAGSDTDADSNPTHLGGWGSLNEESPTMNLLPEYLIDRKSTETHEDRREENPDEDADATETEGEDTTDQEAPPLVDEATALGYFEAVSPSIAEVILEQTKENTRKQVEAILNPATPAKEKAELSHKIAGSIGMLGCAELSKVAKTLENHYEISENPHPELDRLQSVHDESMAILGSLLDKIN